MKRSASTCAAIVELTCVAGLLFAQAASAASGWLGPVGLGGGADPRVALIGAGEAAAVWEAQEHDHYVIEGSVRVAGKWKWGGIVGADGFEPAIATGAEGSAIAVWAGSRGIEAAQTTPSGGWSRLPSIPHTPGAFAPEVATDAAGRATVVWRQPGPRMATIDVATLAPSGEWSAARQLSRPGHPAYSPQVAVAPSGCAVAVWRRNDGEKSIVQAATRDSTGPWSAPADLSARGENAVSPAATIDPADEAIVAWDRFDGAHQIIQASVRPPHGRWSRGLNISGPGRNAEEPQVALSPAGEAVAVWERFDGRADRVQAATRSPGDGWSKPRSLSSGSSSSHEPRLATAIDGLTRVVWTTSEGNGAAIEEASRPAGGPWAVPVRLAGGPTGRREQTVAVAPGGEAVALWAGDGIGATFHPAAPQAP